MTATIAPLVVQWTVSALDRSCSGADPPPGTVGGMSALPLVKQNIDGLVAGIEFGEGNKYFDFDPKVDEVAAWTIGGLVAGKVLAKAGFFVLLAKFAKPLLLLGAGGFAAFRAFFGRRRKEDEETGVVSEEKPANPGPENLGEKKDGDA